MSPAPLISVVIPVFNRAWCLERAVRSVLGQSLGDLEIVVVDDGSTDDLQTVLARLSDARLRVIRHERNLGPASARNTGIRNAHGGYIAFLDSDDEWLPTKLERQHVLLEAHGDSTAVSLCGYTLVREEGGQAEARPLAEPVDWYVRLLSACNVSFGSCALVRRSAFEAFGMLDEAMRRLEDWDWLLRYTAKRPIAALSEPLAIVHGGAGWPAVEVVAAATNQIWDRHRAAARATAPKALRLLRSTILYERAVALRHHGRPLAALWFLGRSIVAFPGREAGFYRNLARRGGAGLYNSGRGS